MLRLQDAATCNAARSSSAEAAVSCAVAGDEVSDIEGLAMKRLIDILISIIPLIFVLVIFTFILGWK